MKLPMHVQFFIGLISMKIIILFTEKWPNIAILQWGRGDLDENRHFIVPPRRHSFPPRKRSRVCTHFVKTSSPNFVFSSAYVVCSIAHNIKSSRPPCSLFSLSIDVFPSYFFQNSDLFGLTNERTDQTILAGSDDFELCAIEQSRRGPPAGASARS